ncbi:hypothetical protein Tco_0808304 [Tanacetum coccineum]
MRWVDRRFKDSFPVVVVEKLCRIVLDCIDEDLSKRPKISRVAGKVSRLYLDSGELADIIHVPNDFTAYFEGSQGHLALIHQAMLIVKEMILHYQTSGDKIVAQYSAQTSDDLKGI